MSVQAGKVVADRGGCRLGTDCAVASEPREEEGSAPRAATAARKVDAAVLGASEPCGGGAAPFPLVDTHCHLDFAGNSEELAAALSRCGGALSGTCDPRDSERTRRVLAGFAPQVRVGLGLHPWWVADGVCGPDEVSLFERLAPGAALISEVGLDFQPRRETTRTVQTEAFTRVCRAAAKPLGAAAADTGNRSRLSEREGSTSAGRSVFEGAGARADRADRPAAACAAAERTPVKRVMSIHSSKAAACVLDILEQTGCLDACTCVFHWFSGSQDELSQAIDAGCLFSVNERMLKTKRGRAYARAIPEGRLLLETDAPPKPAARFSPEAHISQLERTIGLLAEARGADVTALAERIACTSRSLFS